MSTFIHYHSGNFKLDKYRFYPQRQLPFYFKPNGFWLSINDSWKRWCIQENYQLDKFSCAIMIKLNNTKNLFVLKEDKDMKHIIKNYTEGYVRNYNGKAWSFKTDWRKFCEDYSGLIIDTENEWMYDYGYGLGLMPQNFLQAWDCLSACIWKLGDVELEVIDNEKE